MEFLGPFLGRQVGGGGGGGGGGGVGGGGGEASGGVRICRLFYFFGYQF